jgi:hypothetical protein
MMVKTKSRYIILMALPLVLCGRNDSIEVEYRP